MDAKTLKRRKDELKSGRGNWEQYWQVLADYILTRKNQVTTATTPGTRRNTKIFDSTAIKANVRLAAGLHSTLTSPVTRFFDLTTGNPEIDSLDNVRLFTQKMANRIWNTIQNSNFQTEIHEIYVDLGCFGTAGLFIEAHPEKIVNFVAYPIVDLIIGEGVDGVVNEVHREFRWTARQIIEKWGEDKNATIPEKVRRAFDAEPDKKFDLVHSIYPKDLGEKKYEERYFLEDEHSEDIKKGSYFEFPWMVPRWSKDSAEMYGRSPGMDTLPDIRTLNAVVKTDLKGRQKAVDPPLMVPDDGFLRQINLTPGAVNRKRQGADNIEPILTGTRVDLSDSLIQRLRQDVREGFMNDLFTLMEVGDRATAREIDERTQQQLRQLAPILGRMHTELLRPLVDRVYGIMDRAGKLEEAPDELVDANLEAVFASPLARAQTAQEATIVLETYQQLAGLAQVSPQVLDLLNHDESARLVAKARGLPQSLLLDEEDVQAIRQGRAQAQEAQIEQQQEMAQAEQVSKVAPAVAQLEQAQGA